jgi:hypothetical protein
MNLPLEKTGMLGTRTMRAGPRGPEQCDPAEMGWTVPENRRSIYFFGFFLRLKIFRPMAFRHAPRGMVAGRLKPSRHPRRGA